MKFKIRFQRRYSVFITIIACASSILMLVKRFGFPEEDVVQIVWICVGFLVAIICVAAPVAFISRWLSDRSEKDFFNDLEEREKPGRKRPEQTPIIDKNELS